MSAIQLNSPFLEPSTMQQDHADNLTPAQAGTRAMSEVAGATRLAEAVAGEVEALSKRLSAEAAMVESRVAEFIEGVRAA